MLCKFLDPKNDFAFKKIFGTEKNKVNLYASHPRSLKAKVLL
jgi:hypothetical protein